MEPSPAPSGEAPEEQSRKWRMVTRGLISVVVLHILAMVASLFRPTLAGDFITLTQVTVGSIAGLTAIYCGAHALSDYGYSKQVTAREERRSVEVQARREDQ